MRLTTIAPQMHLLLLRLHTPVPNKSQPYANVYRKDKGWQLEHWNSIKTDIVDKTINIMEEYYEDDDTKEKIKKKDIKNIHIYEEWKDRSIKDEGKIQKELEMDAKLILINNRKNFSNPMIEEN